jgi:hypothetical protein
MIGGISNCSTGLVYDKVHDHLGTKLEVSLGINDCSQGSHETGDAARLPPRL